MVSFNIHVSQYKSLRTKFPHKQGVSFPAWPISAGPTP